MREHPHITLKLAKKNSSINNISKRVNLTKIIITSEITRPDRSLVIKSNRLKISAGINKKTSIKTEDDPRLPLR